MVACMSRRICIKLYCELVRLRPDWHHEDDDKGPLKVVMTGAAADPPEWQPHIRNKSRREALAKRFRGTDDPLQMVLGNPLEEPQRRQLVDHGLRDALLGQFGKKNDPSE